MIERMYVQARRYDINGNYVTTIRDLFTNVEDFQLCVSLHLNIGLSMHLPSSGFHQCVPALRTNITVRNQQGKLIKWKHLL